ncbi:MAG: HDOD domain-containing protein, partial [Gammaproteobacteria bacterium]
KDIVAVVEHDPILTMRLLNTVNSPNFGLAREVTSIKQAVVYVGLNTVKNVAIMVATAGTLHQTSKAGLLVKAVWLHSLRVGVISKLAARRQGVCANELASYFVAGLLHDMGKIFCAEYLAADDKIILDQSEDSDKSAMTLEQEWMDVDHAEVGALVAEKWNLPMDLIQAIRYHHLLKEQQLQESVSLPKVLSPLTLAVCFGNLAAHHLERREAMEANVVRGGCEPIVLPDVVRTWVGGGVEEVLESLPGLTEEIQKAQAFIASGAA